MPAKRFTVMPSKLPRDYVTRTLRRLLPVSRLDELTRSQLDTLIATKKKLEASILANPVAYWRPNPGGQESFATCDDPAVRVFGLFAGNKTGKTTAGAIRFAEVMLGTSLWGFPERAGTSPVPVRGAIFAEDFETHKEVTLPTLRSWLPKDAIKREYKNSAGYTTELIFSTGSVATCKTYDQGSEKAEGKDWVAVWCDEPPPNDIYTAIMRGLVVLDGRLYITATLLSETWLYDEAVEKEFIRIFEGSIHENTWIPEQSKRDFLESLTEDQRAVREHGKPMSLTGLIYKAFRNDAPYVIPDHPVPRDYPIIMGVDPHERRPVYVEYAYVTPDDEIIWFAWAQPKGTEDDIFAELTRVESSFPEPPTLCIMDPNRGKAKQMARGSADGTSWSQIFEEHGYNVYMGSDDIRSGHTALRSYLDPENPRMKWMESCRGRNGPIWQMTRYSWEDYKFGKKEREAPEKPKDRNKDYPDIHRYVAVADITFDSLNYGDQVIDRRPEEQEDEETMPRAYL